MDENLKTAFESLNKEQKEAVFSDKDRILVLAGAGTGKTKTMVSRVARLIEDGVDPGSILLLTFTRAAAMEAKERVIALVGEKGKDIYCNTFHAWAVRVLRQFAFQIWYTPAFTIYDDEDRTDVIAAIIEELQYNIKPQDVLDAMEKHAVYSIPYAYHEIRNIVKEYDFRLRRCNSIDMNGLLAGVQTLLKKETVQELLQSRWSHILVDEMQDTDRRQMDILNAINPQNLFAVGDDFQSVYKFRGADVSIIMGLSEDPEYQVIKLEENYRSTHQIVDAANKLIKHNNQTEKVLKAHRNGPEIKIFDALDHEDELEKIVEEISFLIEDDFAEAMVVGQFEPLRIKTKAGVPLKDIAVLGRTNKQIKEIAEHLESVGIPCEIKAAADDVMVSRDAKKLFAWMHVMLNPTDDVSVDAVLNWPVQTITKKERLEVEMFQLEKNCSLFTALAACWRAPSFFSTNKSIEELIEAEYDPGDAVAALDMLDYIIKGTMIEKHYIDQDMHNRVKAIQRLRYIVASWQESKASLGESYSAEDWLDYYTMYTTEGVREESEKKDAVQIMTAHGSKGLEFDTVIIAGCNQGTFPMLRGGDIEEERRLFFVAMTRAKNHLYMTRAVERDFYDFHTDATIPSQFLSECI